MPLRLRCALGFLLFVGLAQVGLAQTAPVLEIESATGDTLFRVMDDGRLHVPVGVTSGYVLTSDAQGYASWQAPAGGGGGLALPFSGAATVNDEAFQVLNNATSGYGTAIRGRSASTSGFGVMGVATATSGLTVGLYGTSASPEGYAVFGGNTATTGNAYGVYGQSVSNQGAAIYGYNSATSGPALGMRGQADSPIGYGVYGYAAAATGRSYGIYGTADSDEGVGAYGVGREHGVHGHATKPVPAYGDPVLEYFYTAGVEGTNANETEYLGALGYYEVRECPTGSLFPFCETSYRIGAAVYGGCTDGDASTCSAGYFDGHVTIKGDLEVNDALVADLQAGGLDVLGGATIAGSLNVSGTKNFRIDHPLDPDDKYLYHFALESSEVLNVYSGNVVTDEMGRAEVALPDWFEAINTDFRYQLTVVGTFAQAIVADEVAGNRFAIRTDRPGVKVSWQVTGVRSDEALRRNPPVVEADKPREDR